MREKDTLNQGKDDWMSYQKKLAGIKDDRKKDADHQEVVAKKIEKKRTKVREGNPDGSFGLG
jgi:hypothetical protein